MTEGRGGGAGKVLVSGSSTQHCVRAATGKDTNLLLILCMAFDLVCINQIKRSP